MMLFARLQTCFPNDVICHAGEINETMYFIKEGIVQIFNISKPNEETLIDELIADDSFGIVSVYKSV